MAKTDGLVPVVRRGKIAIMGRFINGTSRLGNYEIHGANHQEEPVVYAEFSKAQRVFDTLTAEKTVHIPAPRKR